MTICEDCELASTNPLWGRLSWSCLKCRARHISRGPLFHEAKREGYLSKRYTDLLKTCGVRHEDVKEAAV